jgi:hypothetical protein
MTNPATVPSPSAWPRGALITIAGLLVAAFIASRVALLLTSYDTNKNWEEPVFLFSATELARDGVTHIFDHQDDLNHGGSVVLLLLAVPWVRVLGTSLAALKGVAILWSTLTLCAFVAVGWRYFSPRVGLLWGVLYFALSPTAARLNVTLVGSHPEVLLPCAGALAAYFEWLRGRGGTRRRDGVLAFALGVTSGLALWLAYIGATFVMPLLALRLASARRRAVWAALAAGLLLGVAPWLYQDLWLRPYGATLWLRYLGGRAAAGEGWIGATGELAASFGYPDPAGAIVLALCAAAFLALCAGVSRSRWRTRLAAPLALLPLLIAPVLGLALLAHAVIPGYPDVGYYHYRYFMPLQASLFWLVAVAVDWAASAFGRGVVALAVGGAIIAGVWGQAPLYAQGNHYQPDFERDRAAGCMVYGEAEGDRAGNAAAATQRLSRLSDGVCRNSAFHGLGWALAEAFLRDGDLAATEAALATMEPSARWSACGGFLFVLSHVLDTRIPAARGAEVLREVGDFCRARRVS